MILFLHGEDSYRSREKLSEIVREYQRRHSSGLNYVRIDMEESQEPSPIDAVTVALRTQSMFEEKKLLVLERLFSMNQEDREAVQTVLEEEHVADDDDVVVVVWGENLSKAQRKDSCFTYLEKKATVQEFESLHGSKLEGWIREEVANLGIDMTPDGRKELLRSVGDDLWRLAIELRKLRDYAAQRVPKEKDRAVTADLVREIVRPTIETDIFQTIDALGQRNKKVALTLLRNHLAHGEEELRILAMMAYQVRVLLQIKDLVERGVPFSDLASASKLHPFVVKKSFRQAKFFTYEELRAAHRLLFDLDYAIKTGDINARSALEHFILAL